MSKKLTIIEFIEKAFMIHGNSYDYSLFIYKGNKIKSNIKCKVCSNIFQQTPNNHLKGQGCPKCKYIKIGNIKRLTLKEFIEKARLIHGDKYDYSKVIYINAVNKICIVCHNHGEFWQTPNAHLSNRGCPICKSVKIGNLTRLTLKQFIEKARAIHGDKYDYSEVIYNGIFNKVCIICSIHGEFWQTAHNHLNGQGCPSCNSSKGEQTIKNILDKHNINYIREYKLPEILINYEIDFYLPDYNLLIEFHGIQHYEYIPFLHKNDEDNFLKQKERDTMVRDAAIRFKYRYLEFNYKQLKYMTREQFEEMILSNIKKYKKIIIT